MPGLPGPPGRDGFPGAKGDRGDAGPPVSSECQTGSIFLINYPYDIFKKALISGTSWTSRRHWPAR